MAEISTPTPSANPFSVGATKKTLDAEECTVVSFVAETYPGGELLPHNLWFHETWSVFEAPMNILFVETKDGKPLVLILPHPPESTPKRQYQYRGGMKFHGPRPQRPEPERPRAEPSQENESRQENDQQPNAGRPSRFRASVNRARQMFGGIRRPAFEVPPGRWWHEKISLLLKVLVTLMILVFAFQVVSRAPQLRDIIRSKLAQVSQEGSYTDYFNTGRDYVNTNKEQVKADKPNSKSDRNRAKPAKDNSKANKDSTKTDKGHSKANKSHAKAAKDNSKASKDSSKTNNGHSKADKDHAETAKDDPKTKKGSTKTDKGELKFDKNADGSHIRGTWTEPDDTHVTFEASKTSGGDPPVTEFKFMRSEEQFIKDENDAVLFSLNRITRFLVTLIGGEGHDEKLDKIMDRIGSLPSKGNEKVESRPWWWWWW